uniref:Pheophytinase, chloroplastic isoform X3 n=1 Tax=Nicotiana tabacum TaxID=4097 RepID=A0A1S4BMJ8_TOBAC|nr:PREDICTED: pheophytinase, chloroplastic-like isoform X3 [Nicotiana tabacum]
MSASCATAGTEWLNPTEGGRWELNRRNFAINGIVATGASVMPPSVVAESSQGLQQLPFKPEGYNYWTWRGHKIHYVEEGEGFPVVLIHGFGTSAFHWRYNIPELAKNYKVYALDLLGFGWSEKAQIDYDALIWRDQLVDFLKEIVKQHTVLVGNGLGGFTTLLAAAELPAEQVKGVTLLNSAGQFGDDITTTDTSEETALRKFIVRPVEEIFQRVVVGLAFWLSMRPAQIEAQLKSGVYRNHSNVDDYLLNSIAIPAADPNAGEVYYRLLRQLISNPRKYTLESVLSQLSCRLLLLWGDLDPWVDHAKANRIKEFYPNTSLVNLQAGHYPHDEVPLLVNKALLDWLSTLGLSEPSLRTVPEI